MSIEEIISLSGNLPASEVALSVNDRLAEGNTVVITAPPGAGKSTLLPLTIMKGYENGTLRYDGGEGTGKIVMLEPRRLAARQIASRMAKILGEPVGKTVGYRVRFEKRVSEETRIEVVTEGILTRMLVADPTLEGVCAVIFDEFHERSIHSDLALALTRQVQELVRPDLKIVIMSATLGGQSANEGAMSVEEMCNALGGTLVESKGRMYDVALHYPQSGGIIQYAIDDDFSIRGIAEVVVNTVRKAHREHTGDILVFLPGQAEIMKCMELLDGTLPATRVMPLYGNMPPKDQSEVLSRSTSASAEGTCERCVILATPIAETSLTIEGVRVVIDSGLYRTLVFDARTGLSHLETARISMDMATQRMGRAGRMAEGVCYRLWTKAVEQRMAEQRTPEIMEADLASMILEIVAFGESDVESLPWLAMPPKGNVVRALTLLRMLGAIDERDAITPLGRMMAAMPCHPRISRMIMEADTPEAQALACDIAALLEEKDPMADSGDSDLLLRIESLRRCRQQKNLGRWARVNQIAEAYRMMTETKTKTKRCATKTKTKTKRCATKTGTMRCATETAECDAGVLIASAYPERVAMAMDDVGNYRLSSGDNVRLNPNDAMSSYKWLAVASCSSSKGGQAGTVFLAAPLDVESLPTGNDAPSFVSERENVSWSSKELKVILQKERRIGKLLIDSKPLHDADRDTVIAIICEAVKKDGLSMFDWNDDVQRLQRRVAVVSGWQSGELPNVSTDHLMQTAAEWLPLYLEDAPSATQQKSRLRTTKAELRKIDLTKVIQGMLYAYQSPTMEDGWTMVNRLAPTHITMPTGHRIKVDYRQGAEAPVLSVRLQECFELQDTPCVNDGKQPVLMELLSPGFKPVQLTQDLRSFWQGTYFEVRKELKRRYPKHQWPEKVLNR